MFLWKCRRFRDRKCLDLRGTRTPNLRIHAECSNYLSYQGQTFAVPCIGILALAIQIFLSKVNIWNVDCAWATAFIFDSRMDVLVKETENVSTWGGLDPPTFGFMPNALTTRAIRARHLLSHVLGYWLWWYRYFWSKVNIWNVNCARATASIFDSRADILVKVLKI